MVTHDFDELKAFADETGRRPCGTLMPDGTPVYFDMAPEAGDAEVREKAFEIRHGRKMTSYERWALEVAERQYGNLQGELTGAERYFAERAEEPGYVEAYAEAREALT